MREAIATSLLVLSVNSFAGLAGHLSHVDLPWSDLIWIASLAAIGAVIGVFMNRRIPVQWLKDVLGYLVMGVAFLILYREFIW